MRFFTNRGNTNNTLEERMVISSGGNVGIGVNVNTKGLLHIKSGYGSTENCDMIMTSNVTTTGTVMGGKSNIYFQETELAGGALETNSYSKIMGSSDSTGTEFTDGRIDLFTNNRTTETLVSRMTIKNDGKVGIGINEPQNVFQASPYYPDNTYNKSTGNTAGQSGNTVTATSGFDDEMIGMVIVFANNNNSTKTITACSSPQVVTVDGDAETISTGTLFQVFYPGLNVDSTGKVGVGTMSPVTDLDISGSFRTGLVSLTATSSITTVTHAGRLLVMNAAAAGSTACTFTLPLATGTGNIFKFIVGTISAMVGAYKIIVVNSSHTINGSITQVRDDGSGATFSWATASGTDTVILNGTTTGGVNKGDYVEIIDIATNTFAVSGMTVASGAEATPFSATV